MSQVLRVAVYRFRTTLGRRWAGYLSVVILVTLIGGVAMASIAAARRTQSSYPSFLASTNPSELTVSVASDSETPTPYSAVLAAKISHLAGVKRVATLLTPTVVPLRPNGTPNLSGQASNFTQFVGSPDGMFTIQDRVSVTEGKMADPKKADQAVMTASAAEKAGLHIGEVLAFGYFTAAQINSPEFGTAKVRPRLRLNVTLVGIVDINRQVVEDDVDRASGFVIFTPALIRAVEKVSPGGRVELAPGAPLLYGLELDRGRHSRSGRGREGLCRHCPARHELRVQCHLAGRDRGGARGQARVGGARRLRGYRWPRRPVDRNPGDLASGPLRRGGQPGAASPRRRSDLDSSRRFRSVSFWQSPWARCWQSS